MRIYKLSILFVLTLNLVIFSTVLFAKKSPYEEVVKEEEHSYQMVVKRLQHYKKLAKRKTEVKKLYKKNEINQVLALFEMDSKDIDASLAKSDLVISDSLYFDLAVIYKNIAPVKYRLEYYSGLISLLKKNYDKKFLLKHLLKI